MSGDQPRPTPRDPRARVAELEAENAALREQLRTREGSCPQPGHGSIAGHLTDPVPSAEPDRRGERNGRAVHPVSGFAASGSPAKQGGARTALAPDGRADADGALHRMVLDSIDQGFCVIEMLFDDEGAPVDYRFLETNPAFEGQTGLVNAVGKRVRDLVPGLEAHWFETYGAVARTGQPIRFVNSASAMAGRWFDVFAFRIGEPEQRRVALVFTDITRQHAVGIALRQSEERLRQALASARIVVWEHDPRTGATDASGDTEAIHGLPPGALRNPGWDVIHPAHRTEHAALVRRVIADGGQYQTEFQIVRPDSGALAWIEERGFTITSDRDSSPRLLIVATDVTERKAAAAAVDQLAAIMSASNDAILGCTPDGAIAVWNRGAEELFGYSAAEALGADIGLIIPAARAEERTRLFDHVLGGNALPALETVRRRKDGAEFDAEIRLSPIVNAIGEVTGVSAIARDVTERKRLERVHRDFIGMVSHDLANPVTVLRSRAQLMQRRKAYDEAGVATIIDQTRRMERLITDLRDLVLLESNQLELRRRPVDLTALARAACERARMQHPGALIRVEAPEDPVTGHFDPDRLEQVLDNLLGNALKHAPGSEILVRLECLGEEARVTVIDQGPGIPAAALPRLFDRFYRVNDAISAPGLGLGLYITRMLVDAHAGTIRAESDVGSGSRFIVTLPLATC